jgi:hypothetical protein
MAIAKNLIERKITNYSLSLEDELDEVKSVELFELRNSGQRSLYNSFQNYCKNLRTYLKEEGFKPFMGEDEKGGLEDPSLDIHNFFSDKIDTRVHITCYDTKLKLEVTLSEPKDSMFYKTFYKQFPELKENKTYS